MSTLKTEQTAVPAFVPARDGLSLEAKGRIASIVVEDALNQFERPVVMWTAGKATASVLKTGRRYGARGTANRRSPSPSETWSRTISSRRSP